MKAIIMAAGAGSRLKPFTDYVPKPLIPVSFKDGKITTIIEKIIEQIKIANISEIIVVVNYKKELIKDYLGNGSKFGIKIGYAVQKKLDGNGSAVFCCQNTINDDVLITDCDNFVADDFIFLKLRNTFESNKTDAVVCVKNVRDITRFAIFKTDRNGKITDIFEKPSNKKEWGDLAKTGFAILSRNTLNLKKDVCRTDKGEYTTTQLFKFMLKNNMTIVPHLVTSEYEDIGTWESYGKTIGKRI